MAERSAPLVSVVLIYWNEEAHIREAISSVFAQTWDNWELLLVDDGSTDSSFDIAAEAAAEKPGQVRLLHHPHHENRGMSASRNLGISNANGLYVTFIDGDDLWKPSKLASQIGILAKHPELEVVVSPAQWWYESSPDTPDFVQDLDCDTDAVVTGKDLVVGFVRDEWASLCDVMATTDAINEVGGYEDAFGGMFEDQVFHSKLLLGRQVFVTSDWWYRYRQHAATSTSRAHQAGEHRRARIRFLDWLQRYLKAQSGTVDPTRLEVLIRLAAVRFPVVALGRRLVNATRLRVKAGLGVRRRTAP